MGIMSWECLSRIVSPDFRNLKLSPKIRLNVILKILKWYKTWIWFSKRTKFS